MEEEAERRARNKLQSRDEALKQYFDSQVRRLFAISHPRLQSSREDEQGDAAEAVVKLTQQVGVHPHTWT